MYSCSTLRAEASFVFLIEEEKSRLCLNHVKPWGRRSPNVCTSQSCSLLSNVFFECEHPFIDKSKVITEPAVASTQILGLGSKQYPSNMRRMRNKDLTRFIQSLSRECQNQANKRKALLARCIPWHELVILVYFFKIITYLHKRSLNSYFCLKEKMKIARWKQVNFSFWLGGVSSSWF